MVFEQSVVFEMNYICPSEETFYIYKITNTVNNKIYIGRTKVPSYRKRQHLSFGINPISSKVQKIHKAINELGHNNFTFEVFEKVDNYYESCEKELYWINFYNSCDDTYGYNEKSGSTHTVILSSEDKERMSLRVGSEKNPMYGKTHAQDTKNKLSKKFSGSGNPFYGRIHSDETKKKIGKSSKNRVAGENNPHAKLNLEIVLKIREEWKTGNYTKVDLSKKYNVTATTIGNIVSGKTWR